MEIVDIFVEKLEQEQNKDGVPFCISALVKRLTTDTSLTSHQRFWLELTGAALALVWGSPSNFLEAGYDKNGIIEAKNVCANILLSSEALVSNNAGSVTDDIRSRVPTMVE